MATPTTPQKSQTNGRGLRDVSAISLPARYRASRGYSRFVQLMKLLLPLVAVIMIAAIVAWPHIVVDSRKFALGFSDVEISEAKDPSMVNARYIGTDNDNQPFSVTADIARQLADSRQSIVLETPKADITLNDGSWLVLTAQSGLYDRPTQYLDLSGSVNLFHDSGYEIHTQSAGIDMTSGTAEGHEPVSGQGPFGRINSEGFRLIDKGKTIIFTGKTSATLYLNRISK